MTDLEIFKKVLTIIRCEFEEIKTEDRTKLDAWLDMLGQGWK